MCHISLLGVDLFKPFHLNQIQLCCRRHRYIFVVFVAFFLIMLGADISSAQAIENTSPHYAVQAGVYVGPIQSNRMSEDLSRAGYAAWVEERPQRNNQFLYFVLVGPFSDVKQAEEARLSITRMFNIEAFIVDLNDH